MQSRFVSIVILLLAAGRCGAEPLLWGGLKAGPYAVGYRSSWTEDDTRQFDAKLPDGSRFGGGKTPRPIFVNEWYPAERPTGKAAMTQGEYLNLAPSTGKLHQLAEALIQFSRTINAQFLVDAKDPEHPTATENEALKRYYSAPTAAFRDAPAKPGKFPVVIYVHGYGSSFDDNTTLAEYLASNGYVVITSGYQSEQLNMIGDRQEVGDDIQFLIHYAGRLPCCGGEKVALIGHSGGAQSILAYQSRDGAMADALVSLDTTEDYRYTNSFLFKDFVATVKPLWVRVPILFAANPEAQFQLADTLKQSHRYYLTMRDTEHEEFIAEGLARTILLNTSDHEAVDKKYSALCDNVLGFLGMGFKPRAPGVSVWPQPSKLDFENQIVNLEDVPEGGVPAAYTGGDQPPTPRQFRDLILQGKYDLAIATLDKFHAGVEHYPFYATPEATIDFLFEDEQPEAARRLSEAYRRVNPKFDSIAFYVKWGDHYRKGGGKKGAIRMYKRAILLNSDDPRAIEGMKKAEALPNL